MGKNVLFSFVSSKMSKPSFWPWPLFKKFKNVLDIVGGARNCRPVSLEKVLADACTVPVYVTGPKGDDKNKSRVLWPKSRSNWMGWAGQKFHFHPAARLFFIVDTVDRIYMYIYIYLIAFIFVFLFVVAGRGSELVDRFILPAGRNLWNPIPLDRAMWSSQLDIVWFGIFLLDQDNHFLID